MSFWKFQEEKGLKNSKLVLLLFLLFWLHLTSKLTHLLNALTIYA